MTPQELMNNTIKGLAELNNSDFITITHYGVPKKAKVEFGDFQKISKEETKRVLEGEISFVNMITAFVKRGDNIVYEGKTYFVEHWSKVGDGIFNVFCTDRKRIK